MSAVIIDGFQIAADVRHQVAEKTAELVKKGIHPCLAVILVGENLHRPDTERRTFHKPYD